MKDAEQENMNEKVSQEGGKIDINDIELEVKADINSSKGRSAHWNQIVLQGPACLPMDQTQQLQLDPFFPGLLLTWTIGQSAPTDTVK
ncbi:hypothetical protein CapIbe_012630 [Capra ibex]